MEEFLARNPENSDYNQYWYSPLTIERMLLDVSSMKRVAFLSTPSIYFSVPDLARQDCFVFDYDLKWRNDRGFVHYDFNKPEEIPEDLEGIFDGVVIDPPFITAEVWRAYAVTAKRLLRKDKDSCTGVPLGKVILTTIAENAPLLLELFDAKPTAFQPSIPNLVYQYSLFTNYNSANFDMINPEIP